MDNKFGVAVVLYNPSNKQINNIECYKNIFDKLFVFDNSEANFKKDYGESFYKDIIYITENENKGLPYAFNCILETEECKQLDFLCTLDQDSIFKENDITNIQKKLNDFEDSNVGIIAPYIDYGNNHIKNKEEFSEKKWVITSGSFICLKNLYSLNLKYDEKYFIDKFEIDLCQQFIDVGYKVLMYYNSVLYQNLGDGNNGNHSNHSANRHYYIFRNRFYFNNKWFKGLKKYSLNILQTMRHFLLIMIYEKNKKEKIYQFKYALKDYKQGKMGKVQTNEKR